LYLRFPFREQVWTLFDYYGEPSNGGWPYVSSTFGAYVRLFQDSRHRLSLVLLAAAISGAK
jgi:hypothetical protein